MALVFNKQQHHIEWGTSDEGTTGLAVEIEDIVDSDSFGAWLSDQPTGVAQVISTRIALRVLPNVMSIFSVDAPKLTEDFAQKLTLYSFRANFISWAARKYPTHDMISAARSADSAADSTSRSAADSAARSTADSAAFSIAFSAGSAADSAAFSASSVAGSATGSAAYSAAFSARFAADSATRSAETAADSAVWEVIRADASTTLKNGALAVFASPLWPENKNQNTNQILSDTAQKQITNFKQTKEYTALPWGLWIAWWESLQNDTSHSLFGEKADLEIALKGDEFWDRDAAVVMNELAEIVEWPWGEELPQDPRAAEMVVNAEGQIDAKESDPVDLLLDTPQQREEYDDLRTDVAELLNFGQQLGKLQSELDSFLNELPKDFTTARVRPLWRAGNRLRRTLKTHRALEDYPDPHTARLDPEIAEELGYLLETYNNFSFADPGLRQRDERKIPPQERANLEAERKQATPLINDLKEADLLTDAAKQELENDRSENDEDTDFDNVYDDQLAEQETVQGRNAIAAAISGVRNLVTICKTEIKHATRIGADSTYKIAGPAAVVAAGSEALGLTAYHQKLIEFVIRNADALKIYALTAYPGSYAQSIIEVIVRFFT